MNCKSTEITYYCREDEMEKYQNQTGCIKWICSLIFRDNQLVWYPHKRRALHTFDRIKCHSLSITLRSILSMDFYVWMGMGWCSFQYFIRRKKRTFNCSELVASHGGECISILLERCFSRILRFFVILFNLFWVCLGVVLKETNTLS